MKKLWLIIAFVLVAAAHLATPVVMICQRENILRTGHAYKFRTRPVDPVDAFRGRYVQLSFEQDHAPWHSRGEFISGAETFAHVEEGTDGFAVIRTITPMPPEHGDFLKVHAQYRGWRTNDQDQVFFTLPFDRYYLKETKAPKAEEVYREHNRRNQTNLNTYAVVRIKNGDSALEELYVGGKPIQDYLRAAKP